MSRSRRQRRRHKNNQKKPQLSKKERRIEELRSEYKTEDSATFLPRVAINCEDEVEQGWILINTIPILEPADFELDILCLLENDKRAEKVIARYGFFR